MLSANKIMAEKEYKKLLKTLKQRFDATPSKGVCSSDDLRVARDYFFFTFVANTGLRVSEALNLTHEDVFEDYLIIKPEFSKNNKTGTVYFGKHTGLLINELQLFKESYNISNELLLSFNSKPSSRSYMHSRFKYWLKLCDLPNHYSIHTLRHTYASYFKKLWIASLSDTFMS